MEVPLAPEALAEKAKVRLRLEPQGAKVVQGALEEVTLPLRHMIMVTLRSQADEAAVERVQAVVVSVVKAAERVEVVVAGRVEVVVAERVEVVVVKVVKAAAG